MSFGYSFNDGINFLKDLISLHHLIVSPYFSRLIKFSGNCLLGNCSSASQSTNISGFTVCYNNVVTVLYTVLILAGKVVNETIILGFLDSVFIPISFIS